MDGLEYFSEDYVTARERFRGACEVAALPVETLRNPARGPSGLVLTTEVARAGPPDAPQLLVLVSGVHGVETLCGSACQTGWVSSGGPRDLPPGTAVLLVHAINCWGAAWGRRNTEGNIDLCRNFLDYSQPLPAPTLYEDIHAAVNCPELEGPLRTAAERTLDGFVRTHGQGALLQALMGGQYRHPDGFEFGGHAPVWSNLAMQDILARHARRARRVCIVEYHSGLGPYGYGMAVTMHTGEALERTRRWFGEWVHAVNDRRDNSREDFHQIHGHTTEGYLRALPAAEVTSIVLEYGTYPVPQSLPVLLKDHWLEIHGDPESAQGSAVRAELWRLHHPLDPEWRRSVWSRSGQVLRQAFQGLRS